jgi:subtilisin family serine protease
MTGVPPRDGPGRGAIVSPLVLTPGGDVAPAAAKALLTDEQDRRVVLVELRLVAGADPDSVRADFLQLFEQVFRAGEPPPQPVPIARHYMRCALTPDEVDRLVRGGATSSDASSARQALGLIYHVWPDLVIEPHLDRSLTTVKADAATRTFSCRGSGVVWGVLDSGIDEHHPHFAGNNTLSAPAVSSLHRDFTIAAQPNCPPAPLTDTVGHGTHIAGIIAGHAPAGQDAVRIATNEPTLQGLPQWAPRELAPGTCLSGVAPNANLVSLKVLDDNGTTLSSVVIDALDYVRTVNSAGRDLQIHGVNLSFGCNWLPTDYAAGQSPLCRELDLLVGSGVVAVVSAGNFGAGTAASGVGGTVTGVIGDVYGQLSTITDPGTAASAITVGSVHRYRPHTYGVTFNSSKGPTLDGRLKPDLVAPGERITSAATGRMANGVGPLNLPGDPPGVARYVEDSGTSMAAAHVSGVIAAFLSARTEYVGQPQMVKQLFMDAATDLGRHQFFQGRGLIDLMRALTST